MQAFFEKFFRIFTPVSFPMEYCTLIFEKIKEKCG